jgi:hypothetical protein
VIKAKVALHPGSGNFQLVLLVAMAVVTLEGVERF